jgi:DNA replication protein DnaC
MEILGLLMAEGRGLKRLEANADITRIPERILHALPMGFQKGHLEGGFGLGGAIGIGKTQAVAAFVIALMFGCAEEKIVPSITAEGTFRMRFPSVSWSSWPDETHWLRSHAFNGAGERVDQLATSSLLILDDLGRERVKSPYTQDYAASQLDYIVNSRYRDELPTIWTTNLREGSLVELYGASMVRRLIEPNPLAWVSDLTPFNTQKRPG